MGCTLNYTVEDHRQAIKHWGHRVTAEVPVTRAQRERIRGGLQRASAENMVRILSNAKNPAYPALSGMVAKAIRAEQLADHDLSKVPTAIKTILRHSPDAMGLFEKAPLRRGTGSSPVQHPYEALCAAALIQRPFYSTSGRLLCIDILDRMDFGLKFAADHAHPKRYGTVEADLLIEKRTTLALNDKTIAVDAKYSKTGRFGAKDDFDRELAGFSKALLDGQVDEVYFVTNGVFGRDFEKKVETANVELARKWAETHNRLYQEGKHTIDRDQMTREEKKSTPLGKIDLSAFEQPGEKLAAFIRKYNVPQIDMCTHVDVVEE